MSYIYVKKRKSKIKFLRFLIFIIILLITLFFIIKEANYRKNYDKKILYLKEIDEKMSLTEENNNGEVKTYYVSADGTSKDGTDINSPMSLKEANKKVYYGNERVLFKNGDIFYGTINFEVEATKSQMFYIGTYGDNNEMPIISGANILKNKDAWEIDEKGIYKI